MGYILGGGGQLNPLLGLNAQFNKVQNKTKNPIITLLNPIQKPEGVMGSAPLDFYKSLMVNLRYCRQLEL